MTLTITLAMKTALSAVLIALPAIAQSDFGPQQVINPAVENAISVYATDLDGDADADVLSASIDDDKIAWNQNLGGGAFGPEQVISLTADVARAVYATDLDGDADADVLSASMGDDKIAWYENLGSGAFGAEQVISLAADGAISVYATDLDGDGDADVLSASINDDKIAWYENLGGGAFAAEQAISTMADAARAVYATDLDGDGKADVLSASELDDKIAWYKNLGDGAFGLERVISQATDGANSVYATDLDGDGDVDVQSASTHDDKIAWYENQGGGAFGPQQLVSQAADFAQSVHATDLDGDGDADLLSASAFDDKVAWYENFGGGVFGPQQVITQAADYARSVYATDLNGDGGADVLSASALSHTIAWHENLMSPFDCNGNGMDDQVDITTGISLDCNGDGVPDECSTSATLLEQDFTGATGAQFVLLVSAQVLEDAVRLTPASGDLISWLQFTEPVSLVPGGISVEFSYRAGNGSGADGLEVVLVDAATHTPGVVWGVGKGDRHVRVFFDTWQNKWDPDGNHVDAWCDFNEFETVPLSVPIDDYAWHRAALRLTADSISLAVLHDDGTSEAPIVQAPLPCTPMQEVLLGFRGLTGGHNNEHWVDDIRVSRLFPHCAPMLTAVSPDTVKAQNPDTVVLSGNHLISTTSVTVLGVPAPFVAAAESLTVDTSPVPPGFGLVSVTTPFGTASLPVAAWPHLLGASTGPGGTLDATIDNGEVGLYVLALATSSLPVAIPIASPPTWYGVLLNPGGPLFVLSTGAFATSDPVVLSYPVPPNPNLAGLNLYLQAWCQQGFFGPEVTYSFTNMAGVTL